MPHTVWNLGSLAANTRVQPRQFVAGIEPAREMVIGRRREPKKMMVLLDAWIEVLEFDVGSEDFNGGKYSLALGKDPLNTALLLPVGAIYTSGVGTTNPNAMNIKQQFRAQGTMWAAKEIAIDFREIGAVVICDVDVHLDWTVASVDWWTWFVGWNDLEASPDGMLIDGERAYA